jgi:hypothetical protein
MTMRPAQPPTLPPTLEEAAEAAAEVLGVTSRPAGSGGLTLTYPDGHQAALEVATIGEPNRVHVHGDPETALHWPAPGRWWWRIAVYDVRGLPRLREVFPVVARACEAADARGPDGLPAAAIAAIPDLHWLVHTGPARLTGDPTVLDRSATMTLGPGRPGRPGMASVMPALHAWLADESAERALARLGRRRLPERQLHVSVGCTGIGVDAVHAILRATGVPPTSPPTDVVTHLWLAPTLARTVFLWSVSDGWRRHER